MNEHSTTGVLVDLFELDEELGRVMLGVCEELRTKESNDMISDDVGRFVLEVCVVDSKRVIEPSNFIRDEPTRYETLRVVTIVYNEQLNARDEHITFA